jgi:hypothetical protein
MINNVCDGALLLGYARQDSVLGPAAIREVAEGLGLLAGGELESGRNQTPQKNSLRRGLRRLGFGFRR